MGREKKPRIEDYEPGATEYLKLELELLKRKTALLKNVGFMACIKTNSEVVWSEQRSI